MIRRENDDLGISPAMLAWVFQHIHLNAGQRPIFDSHRPPKQRKEYGWPSFVYRPVNCVAVAAAQAF
jgi:hypothetical protein